MMKWKRWFKDAHQEEFKSRQPHITYINRYEVSKNARPSTDGCDFNASLSYFVTHG